ncbi:MFS transporter [Catenovulum sediminis]|uniref:MFS transporter n=1 Tax=Catenovulum sediminis TaxID=1740262 RepID=A0ABV1RCK1_9ALTE|nr:MFS transporter [Catenovulum sediminis]
MASLETSVTYSSRFNKTIITVLICHFIASFSVLGMPLFLPKVMNGMLAENQQMLIGWFYVLPTVCTALATPWWGRFADKYGKRLSLIRAQLGLALGFIIAGTASEIWQFSIGLIIQGFCGGTFAASNAYLSSQVGKNKLASTLNLTQFSARLSLLTAPVILGLFMGLEAPLKIYCYLALLPLIAAVVITRLPKKEQAHKPNKNSKTIVTATSSLSFNQILLIKFLFSFSTVVSFPYFLPYMQSLQVSNESLIGFYFSLPHLIYLIVVMLNPNWQTRMSAQQLCRYGLAILGISAGLQFQAEVGSWMVFWRLLMGLGICLTFIGLHQSVSALKTSASGLMFGRFDSASKWAGVVAGFCAGIIVQQFTHHTPFLLSMISALLALTIVLFPRFQSQLKDTEHAE